ncbi:predicted protein [Sclerotinia sclerotiorum 1980 UF-70]|uniref:Uncharacterized protein n=1 Tax=Sclerotinia sclerotiorum (strain ATCC 18683 / 1980 / Ss-1) TaxID=665079 RepID=A7EGV5_SCLS1|nr:predicted protein [Sclerotinia sclerotiorum 1980 UF-70]EDO02071.1 predicted protein [Sclerotinia sclerotiorum 1980 UF-70]
MFWLYGFMVVVAGKPTKKRRVGVVFENSWGAMGSFYRNESEYEFRSSVWKRLMSRPLKVKEVFRGSGVFGMRVGKDFKVEIESLKWKQTENQMAR